MDYFAVLTDKQRKKLKYLKFNILYILPPLLIPCLVAFRGWLKTGSFTDSPADRLVLCCALMFAAAIIPFGSAIKIERLLKSGVSKKSCFIQIDYMKNGCCAMLILSAVIAGFNIFKAVSSRPASFYNEYLRLALLCAVTACLQLFDLKNIRQIAETVISQPGYIVSCAIPNENLLTERQISLINTTANGVKVHHILLVMPIALIPLNRMLDNGHRFTPAVFLPLLVSFALCLPLSLNADKRFRILYKKIIAGESQEECTAVLNSAKRPLTVIGILLTVICISVLSSGFTAHPILKIWYDGVRSLGNGFAVAAGSVIGTNMAMSEINGALNVIYSKDTTSDTENTNT